MWTTQTEVPTTSRFRTNIQKLKVCRETSSPSHDEEVHPSTHSMFPRATSSHTITWPVCLVGRYLRAEQIFCYRLKKQLYALELFNIKMGTSTVARQE